MQRVNGPTAGPGGSFVGGDPSVPTPPTVVPPWWLTAVQEEIVAVVLAAGLGLDQGNSAQLLAAIRALIASGGTALASDAETVAGQLTNKAVTPHGAMALGTTLINAVVGGAPASLSTLKALATAIGNDPSFSGTVAAALAARALTTRQINGGGLAAGGGDLTNDRTITVAAAGFADYVAGTRTDAALTPAALGAGAGSNQYGKWTTLPGGFLMQWGRVTINPNGGSVTSGSITFPRPFTTSCDSITGNADGPANGQWQAVVVTFNGGPSLAGCQVDLDSAGQSKQPLTGAKTVFWKAIGQ